MNGIAERKGHQVMLTDRRDMRITGVREVLGFDEESVELMTVCGEMTVEGSGLRVKDLNTERGEVLICGSVEGMQYHSTEEKGKRGFLGRLSR